MRIVDYSSSRRGERRLSLSPDLQASSERRKPGKLHAVKLNRVYFNYEASDLSPEEKIVLNEVARRASGTTQSVVELRGYSDGMESAQRGTVLATQRSQMIAHYLTANGVAQHSILLVASDGMKDEAKSINPEHRRVDIRVFTVVGSGDADTHPGLASR